MLTEIVFIILLTKHTRTSSPKTVKMKAVTEFEVIAAVVRNN